MKNLLYASIVCTLLAPQAFAVPLAKSQKAAYVANRIGFQLAKSGSTLVPGSIRIRTSISPYNASLAILANAMGLFFTGDGHTAQFDIVSFVVKDKQGVSYRGQTGLTTLLNEPNSFSAANCESVNSSYESQGRNSGCLVDKNSGTQFLMLFFNPETHRSLENPDLMSDLDFNLILKN